MKKTFFVLMIVLATIFMSKDVFAQSAWVTGYKPQEGYVESGRGGIKWTFKGTIDSTHDTLTSSAFTLGLYDNDSWITYPHWFGVAISGTSTATRKLCAEVIGSFDGTNYFVVDTLLYKDSSSTYIKKTFDNNNIKCPYYKLNFFGTTGNDNTSFTAVIYAYRKDVYTK